MNEHMHLWDEVDRVFVPPVCGPGDGARLEFVLGVTVVELRCPACGAMDEATLLGSHPKEHP